MPMASSKEMQTVRPLTHRPSMSNMPNGAVVSSPGSASSLGSRQPHSRTGSHSHSIIGAALNANHRVSRRKSMTSPGATNVAAMAALIQEAEALPIPSAGAGERRHTVSKIAAGGIAGSPGHFPRPSAMAGAMAIANGTIGGLPLPSPPASLPGHKFVTADGSAIDDDLNDMSDVDDESALRNALGPDVFDIARIRRASDGQPLAKEGRRSSRMDLRCDKCGKGYKHSSCLTKHLWEHTPEWSFTSKLLISKHQQVQLLEAASVLVAMNNQHPGAAATTPPDSAHDFTSERDSASPTASTYSEQNDGPSSVDTTPPPHMDGAMNIDGPKRESSVIPSSPPSSLPADHRSFLQRLTAGNNGGVSQSYQSGLPTAAVAERTLPKGSISNEAFIADPHQARRGSIRPSSSGRNMTGQEDNELAAAVELLSCSFNSANGEVHGLARGVPPVPPVPVQYLGQSAQTLDDTSFINSFPSRAPESFTRGERLYVNDSDDVMMEDSGESLVDEDEDDTRSRARSDDDDDGVFGRMEE